MSRRRFYATPEDMDGSVISLSVDETHHLTRVLRLKPGAEVFVFDGHGSEYSCTLLAVERDRAKLEVTGVLHDQVESPARITLAQALAKGEKPDPDSIRPEEFYNAFDYSDPGAAPGERVTCNLEQSAHPFLQPRNLVRIAMKVPASGRGQGQPLRLTVLLDTSGSMEREDRAASLRRAMEGHERAARSHERAAEAHEQAARKGIGDSSRHERQAVQHRRDADADRAEAAHDRERWGGDLRAVGPDGEST